MNVSVDLIFKIAGIGIVVTVMHQILDRSGRQEQAMMVTLAGVTVVLFMIIKMISELFATVKTMFQLY